jgi:methyltransferase family protein
MGPDGVGLALPLSRVLRAGGPYAIARFDSRARIGVSPVDDHRIVASWSYDASNLEGPDMVTPERLMQFTFGFAPPLVIEAGLRHGVFELLNSGAKTVDQVCAETHTSERGMRALLNALVGLELLIKDLRGGYALTDESATFLLRGKPSFHGAFFLLTSEAMLPGWRNLYEIVRTGRPAQQINLERDGVPFFLQFVEDIFPIHYPAAQRLAEVLGVSQATEPLSVLDLAAGVWRLERRARATIAARTRHCGRLAGRASGHAQGDVEAWRRRPVPVRRGRFARSELR